MMPVLLLSNPSMGSIVSSVGIGIYVQARIVWIMVFGAVWNQLCSHCRDLEPKSYLLKLHDGTYNLKIHTIVV